VIFGLGLVACGSSGATGVASTTGGVAAADEGLTIDTGAFEIPAGDSSNCFYTGAHSPADFNVPSATAIQGPTGHHALIYYIDADRPVGHHICSDAEMVSWNQIIGASLVDGNGGEFQTGVPAGAAVKVPEGKQIVIQFHHVNTTGKPMMVDDSVTIKSLAASDVKFFINSWLMFDEQVELPAQAKTTRVTECTVDEDLDVITFAGHMHEWGTHYTLERLGAGAATLYDSDWSPSYSSHPPLVTYTLDAPYKLAAGTLIRQTCVWDNNTPDVMTVPKEMCAAFAYYFPDHGQINCNVQYPK
jgi:hypothetical protein